MPMQKACCQLPPERSFFIRKLKNHNVTKSYRNAERIKSYSELKKVGDYVVHVNHGIGKF